MDHKRYLRKLEKVNVSTFDSNDVGEVIDWLHDHDQSVEKKNNEILAVTDKPILPFNFATNNTSNC